MTLGSRSCKSVSRHDPWTVLSGPSCSHLVVQSLSHIRLRNPMNRNKPGSSVPPGSRFAPDTAALLCLIPFTSPLCCFFFSFYFFGGCAGSFFAGTRVFSSCVSLIPTPDVWHLSSSTRDRTYVSCFGRQILNHWITREFSPTLAVCEARWSFLGQTSTQRCTHMPMATHTHRQKNMHMKAAPLH